MADERLALAPRLVVEAERRRVNAADEDEAFEAGGRGRERRGRRESGVGESVAVRENAAPGDLNAFRSEEPAQALARPLANFAHGVEAQAVAARRAQSSALERVLRVLFQAPR